MKVRHICNFQRRAGLIGLSGIFVALALILTLGLSIHTTSYAYTEEEIAQAKAWLSAHGYSPDAGGASQAYQDYLNGKFDEELGITTETAKSSETDKATTETTESDSNTETVTEEGNKIHNEKNKDDSKTESVDITSPSAKTEETGKLKKDGETGENSSEKSGISLEKKENISENELQQQDIEEVNEQQDSEFYDEASTGRYRNAILVILLGVVCMLLLILFVGKR